MTVPCRRWLLYAWDVPRIARVVAVGSPRHVTGVADPLLNEPDRLMAELREQKYRSYLRGEKEEEAVAIRRTTATGRPLGSAGFLETLESRLGRVLSLQKRGRPHNVAGK